MAGKRKVHRKADLTVPMVEHRRENDGTAVIAPEAMPPAVTTVKFPPNALRSRSFDFAPYYGHGVDQITYACQRQIERFLAKQDGERETTTVVAYATIGLAAFLPYLMLRSAAIRRPLTLADLNREVIDDYLRHLADRGVGRVSQKSRYNNAKSVLTALATSPRFQ
jgi:hypothetical protein